MHYEDSHLLHPVPLLPDWASVTCRRAIAGRYVNMLFKDHAFIRMVHLNMHPLGGGMWRSAQPTPGQIRLMADQGIRTIINLRGRRQTCGSYFFEVRGCAKYGIELIDFPVRSRDAPRRDDISGAIEMWRRIHYPAVMHCKAGADRVGLMSVLYAFLVTGQPLEQAMEQLHWRFGHLRQAKTGILDAFFLHFLDSGGRSPAEFLSWLEQDYDPARFKAAFLSKRWANFVADRVLRRE